MHGYFHSYCMSIYFSGHKYCKQYNQNANLSNCILCKDNMGFLFHVFYVKKCLKDAYNKPRKCEQMNAPSLLYKSNRKSTYM